MVPLVEIVFTESSTCGRDAQFPVAQWAQIIIQIYCMYFIVLTFGLEDFSCNKCWKILWCKNKSSHKHGVSSTSRRYLYTQYMCGSPCHSVTLLLLCILPSGCSLHHRWSRSGSTYSTERLLPRVNDLCPPHSMCGCFPPSPTWRVELLDRLNL